VNFIKQRIALPTGVELDVWSAGDPVHPPIIFLHGFPESHRTWRHQMAELARDHYVADALGLPRFTLAAHDWGGAIGWAAALKAPERISRLIICNAPHPLIFQRTLIDDLPQRKASQYILAFRDTIEARIAENGLEWFFEHSFMRHLQASNVSAEDRAAYLDEWGQPGAIHAMLNWYRATPMHVPAMDEVPARPAFLDAPFPVLKMPVLIVWGLKDPALLPCQLEGLDALVADLTIARIDCGHFTPWEAPEAVNVAMRNFLQARPV
jgi:pimeloyl-ACP methyl ester carboxylesterase